MNRAPNLQNSAASETRKTPEKERADYDYKEIAREVLARIDQRLADLEDKAPPRPSGAPYDPGAEGAGEIEPVGVGMNPDDRSALVSLALRGLLGLVAVASLFGAIAYLWSHLDAAEQLSPRAVLSSVMPEEKAQPVAEPGPPAAAHVVAEASSAQAAMPAQVAAPAQQAGAQVQAASAPSPARIASDNDRPAPASVSPELAALLRKLDRDIAGLAQAVNELRVAQQQASQQASDDTTKSADEIKDGVNQLARSIVKAEQEEQTARQKPATPARAAAPAAAPRNRRAAPMYYSPRDAQAEFLR